MEENSCRTCMFWMPNQPTRETPWASPEAMGDMGICRRYPPRPIWIDSPNMPDPNMRPDIHCFMPIVHADIWCGEYKFKGSGKSKSKSKSKK